MMNQPPILPDVPLDSEDLSRRALLLRGGRGLTGLVLFAAGAGAIGSSGLLGGCAARPTTASGAEGAGGVDDLHWPSDPLAGARGRPRVSAPMPAAPTPAYTGQIIPRSAWARGAPVTARMDRADRPFDRITVHHDGMGAFTSSSQPAASARLEMIRNGHLGRAGEPFGDIGYHYLIDPAGRVWEGRSIRWQGAHVAKQNPGNLGICMLGNYNQQSPNSAQMAALNAFVAAQMRQHRVPIARVYTHQELAPTACPGNSLQRFMIDTRRGGALARA